MADTSIPAGLIAELPKLDGPKAKHARSILAARRLSTRKQFIDEEDAEEFDKTAAASIDPSVVKKKLDLITDADLAAEEKKEASRPGSSHSV